MKKERKKRKNEETSCNKEARREEGRRHKGIIEEMADQTKKGIQKSKKVRNACTHTRFKKRFIVVISATEFQLQSV